MGFSDAAETPSKCENSILKTISWIKQLYQEFGDTFDPNSNKRPTLISLYPVSLDTLQKYQNKTIVNLHSNCKEMFTEQINQMNNAFKKRRI